MVITPIIMTSTEDSGTTKIDATRSGTSIRDIMSTIIMKKFIIDAEEMTLVTYPPYRQTFGRPLASI